ncbi:MAG: WG repeat-containing protein [Bacteroidales bacterium]|nr:WG repeat-containing protein [Bacteroidales bacterium]
MGLYQLYGFNSAGSVSMEEAARLFALASDKGEASASLLLGLMKEVSADYSSAIRLYSKGYWQLNPDSSKTAGKVASDQFSSLRIGIQSIISTQGFCSYSGGKFQFRFTDPIRKELSSKLPSLSRDLDRYREDVLEKAPKEIEGEAQHKYWNLLFMPLTVISAAAGRDYINSWLEERGFPTFKPNPQFENAIGRCLIDDDDSTDNDYIISGLRIIAGHDKDPWWQYLTGLWYENDPDSKDLKEAALWYEMAKSHLPAASDGFERVTSNPIYRIPDSIEEGTAQECMRLAQSYGTNRELANAWNIEAALRGDTSAVRKLEQMSPAIEKDIKKSTPFYSVVQSEQKSLESNLRSWKSGVSALVRKMQKEEEDRIRKEEEERLRKELEEKLRLEREEKLRLEKEEKLRREEEERLRKEQEERLRKEREEKLRKEQEEKLRKEKEEMDKLLKALKLKCDDALTSCSEAARTISSQEKGLSKIVSDISSKKKAIPQKKQIWPIMWLIPDPETNKELNSVLKQYNALHKKYTSDVKEINSSGSEVKKILDSITKNESSRKLSSLKEAQRTVETILSDTRNRREGMVARFEEMSKLHKKISGIQVKRKVKISWAGVIVLLLIVSGIIFFSGKKDRATDDYDTYSFVDDSSMDSENYFNDSYDAGDSDESSSASSTDAGPDAAVSNWKDLYDFVYSKDSKTGLIKVEKDNLYGFVKENGEVVVPPQYDYIYSADNQGWIKVEKGDFLGFIDKTGKEVIPVKYTYIYSVGKNGWRQVENGKLKGYIDGTGKEVVQVKYTYIYSLGGENGWTKVEINDLKGFIDEGGKEIVAPQFTYISSPDKKTGLRKVEIKNKSGVLNDSGILILPCEYDSVSIDSDGTVKVTQGNKTGRTDKTGKFIVPLE